MDRRKKFDYELFKQNDKLAREVGKAYWKSKGRTAIDNPDKYGPDLVVDGEFYVMGGNITSQFSTMLDQIQILDLDNNGYFCY